MIEIEVDEELYKCAERVLQDQGMTVEAAVTEFMKKIVIFGNFGDKDDITRMFIAMLIRR